MDRTPRLKRWVQLAAVTMTTGMLLQNGCLVENFWAEKFSEVVNRSIFLILNIGLDAANLPAI